MNMIQNKSDELERDFNRLIDKIKQELFLTKETTCGGIFEDFAREVNKILRFNRFQKEFFEEEEV